MSKTTPRNSDMLLNEPYFYTATIQHWNHLLAQDDLKTTVVESLQKLVQRQLVVVYGWVIMPNHIHLIWELLQKNGKELPDSSLLKFSAHAFKQYLRIHNPQLLEIFGVQKQDRAFQFWQRDPLAVKILNREMLHQKLNYIHLNPLAAHWNLTSRPENYRWSSAQFYETGKDEFEFVTHLMDRF